MKIRKSERGQALVLTLLATITLIGFAALATDVGLLFRARRNMQIAADSAATAAALDYLYYGSTTSAITASKSASAANGVTNGSNGAVVTINTPPASGPSAGKTGFFEAIVSSPHSVFLMPILYGGNSVTVNARAVAGTPGASKACIYIGDPTDSDTLHLQGATTISTPGCGIYVNSSSSTAVKVTGNSSSVTASYFNDYGGDSGHNTSPTSITTNAPAQSDPLGNIPGPALTACTSGNTVTALTVTPTLLSAASSASGVVCFSAAHVTLQAGLNLPGSTTGIVYLFENGVTIPVGSAVTFGSGSYNAGTGQFTSTAGATMDLYGTGSSAGTLNQASNSLLNIYAPTSGAHNGVAIMEPPSNTTTLQVQFGSNNETLDGHIYAPGAEVYLQDNGGGVTASGVVANTMFVKSSSLTIPNYSAANPTSTPFRVVSLVE
jgi:Putative Flp pilus-assembly TadE/G-like